MKSVTVDDSGDVYDGSEGNDRDDVGGPDQHEAGAVGLLTSDSLSMDGLLFPILTKCYQRPLITNNYNLVACSYKWLPNNF